MDAMDPHENEAQVRLERLTAELDALMAQYEQSAADALAAHEQQAQLAELARAQAALHQTQAALDPARLTTPVAQVRRWAEVETYPN